MSPEEKRALGSLETAILNLFNHKKYNTMYFDSKDGGRVGGDKEYLKKLQRILF